MGKKNQILNEIRLDPEPLAIAKLSRFYWEMDGSPECSGTRYWLRAEAEVLRERGLQPHPDELWMGSVVSLGLPRIGQGR